MWQGFFFPADEWLREEATMSSHTNKRTLIMYKTNVFLGQENDYHLCLFDQHRDSVWENEETCGVDCIIS